MRGEIFATLILAALLCNGCARGNARRTASGPAPVPPETQETDVEELIALGWRGGTGSIPAILRLRDIGDARAVSALEKLLEQRAGTGNVTAYSAAQALHCIGTDQAHAILRHHLRSPAYSLRDSIRYACHCGMAPDERDEFIRRYHLESTVQDLHVTLEAISNAAADGQRLRFVIRVENTSDAPLTVAENGAYAGGRLLIEDSEGRFHRGFTTVLHKLPAMKHEELPPGGQLTLAFEAEPMRLPKSAHACQPPSAPQSKDIFLVSRDYALHLGSAGKFNVRAIYHAEAGPARVIQEHRGISNFWFGTIVSEPVEIEVHPVKKRPSNRLFMSLPPAQVTISDEE